MQRSPVLIYFNIPISIYLFPECRLTMTANGRAWMWRFENRQPVTAAKFINKSSVFILLPGVIRRLELISEQKVENIFVAPPYCQTECVCSQSLSIGVCQIHVCTKLMSQPNFCLKSSTKWSVKLDQFQNVNPKSLKPHSGVNLN